MGWALAHPSFSFQVTKYLMARTSKPKALKFFVDLDPSGVPFVASVEFCSAAMSISWGQAFAGVLDLNEDNEPYVAVHIIDRYSNAVEIAKSPFTGGDITTEVSAKNYDAIVAALQKPQFDEDEELPPPANEAVEEDEEVEAEDDDQEVEDDDNDEDNVAFDDSADEEVEEEDEDEDLVYDDEVYSDEDDFEEEDEEEDE